jgi:hypothetical protein
MQVKIRILGGAYYGTEWVGDLAETPVSIVPPEGIISARTTEEGAALRASIARSLETSDAVEVNATGWALRVQRIDIDPRTIHPVELDGWYEHTDGTFGFYVGAARAGGPTMTQGPCAAHECVKRDERGAIYEVGWPTHLTAAVRP